MGLISYEVRYMSFSVSGHYAALDTMWAPRRSLFDQLISFNERATNKLVEKSLAEHPVQRQSVSVPPEATAAEIAYREQQARNTAAFEARRKELQAQAQSTHNARIKQKQEELREKQKEKERLKLQKSKKETPKRDSSESQVQEKQQEQDSPQAASD